LGASYANAYNIQRTLILNTFLSYHCHKHAVRLSLVGSRPIIS